ncbi:MAG: antibiotic biosynthesis monooxygenase [Alphaproteobacteria bacterium]|nr:MAG: antibiotic biosynthesis monooxygenase [Alphaproteobacteria bacterium]
MSGHVYWILAVEIKPGEYDNFIDLMTEMVAATKADEPGALNYEWSVSADKKSCHIFERYADSDATLTHMKNFGTKFAKRFMGVLIPKSFTLYGDPTETVVNTISAMQPVVMERVGGFSR